MSKIYNIYKLNKLVLIPFFLIPLLFINKELRELGTVIYFIVFAPFLVLVVFNTLLHSKFVIKQKFSNTLYLFVCLIIVVFNYSQKERDFFYLLLSLLSLLLLFNLYKVKIKITNSYVIRAWIFFYFILTFFLLKTHRFVSYEEAIPRFSGMFLSPSVLGIMSIALYVFYLKLSKKKINLIILYLILIYILFETRSRLDLVLGFLLPFYYFFINKNYFTKNDFLIFFSCFIIFLFFYPLYDYFSIGNSISLRDNSTSSDNSRAYFTLSVLQAIKTSNFLELLFGHGVNSSFYLLPYRNIKPHNDFLRIFYDYGIVFFIIYMKQLYLWFKNDRILSFLIIIYLASFYHNMIFDLYLVLFIVFLNKIEVLKNG